MYIIILSDFSIKMLKYTKEQESSVHKWDKKRPVKGNCLEGRLGLQQWGFSTAITDRSMLSTRNIETNRHYNDCITGNVNYSMVNTFSSINLKYYWNEK